MKTGPETMTAKPPAAAWLTLDAGGARKFDSVFVAVLGIGRVSLPIEI